VAANFLGTGLGDRFGIFGEALGSSRKGCSEQQNQLGCRESALNTAVLEPLTEARILHGKEGVDGSNPSEGF
jgi:hypothetical protein